MTKRFKLFLAIILGMMAMACCAVGCKVGLSGLDEELAKYNGGHVTYYANGGCFKNNTSIVIMDMYFKKPDVPFFDITDNPYKSVYVLYGGNNFTGWYLPARYEEGEHAGEVMYTHTYATASKEEVKVAVYPKLNDDGTPVTDSSESRPVFYYINDSGEVVDVLEKDVRIVPDMTQPATESLIIGADDELIVCATWEPALKFSYKLAVEEEGDYVSGDNTYHKGDEIFSMSFGNKETSSPGQTMRVNLTGMTFVANYMDEACTILAPDNYKYEDYKDKTEIVVWSKYIKGSWTIIKNDVNKVREMFTGLNSSSNAYYLLSDVDCSSISNSISAKGIRAKIEGNGHTLSNLTFKATSLDNNFDGAAVFGPIYATAEIKNLKLENINIEITGKGSLTFYAVCKSVASGAKIENLTIKDITATIDIPSNSIVKNAQNDDRSSWIFGGSASDAAFLAAYDVTLEGTNTLTIK